MKYLKKFNENKTTKEEVNDLRKITSFCEGYLSPLYDEDFVCQVVPQRDRYDIWLEKSNDSWVENENKSVFTFESIKDIYIPFIIMLSDEYELHTDINERDSNKDLKSIHVKFKTERMASLPYKKTEFSVNDIEDTISNTEINYIIISIKNNI